MCVCVCVCARLARVYAHVCVFCVSVCIAFADTYSRREPITNLLLGLARTIYIRCIYGMFGREIIKYTVIYGVYIRFWPTLQMCCT